MSRKSCGKLGETRNRAIGRSCHRAILSDGTMTRRPDVAKNPALAGGKLAALSGILGEYEKNLLLSCSWSWIRSLRLLRAHHVGH